GQRVWAAGQAVAGQSISKGARDGDNAFADLGAVDKQLAGPRRTLAELEVGRTGSSKLPAQGGFARVYLRAPDDLVLLQTEVVVRELRPLLFVDEERVAAEAAAVRQQHAFCAFLGNFDLGADGVRAVADVDRVGEQ